MITKEQKRSSEVWWKRGNSFSKCHFLEIYEIPREVGPLLAAKVKYDGEEYTLRPDELFGSYLAMFKEKHCKIIAALNGVWETKRELSRQLAVPYSRVLNVHKEAKELGICHEKVA